LTKENATIKLKHMCNKNDRISGLFAISIQFEIFYLEL